jgi:hypothetical protein
MGFMPLVGKNSSQFPSMRPEHLSNYIKSCVAGQTRSGLVPSARPVRAPAATAGSEVKLPRLAFPAKAIPIEKAIFVAHIDFYSVVGGCLCCHFIGFSCGLFLGARVAIRRTTSTGSMDFNLVNFESDEISSKFLL